MERQLTEREQYVIDTCISVFDRIPREIIH